LYVIVPLGVLHFYWKVIAKAFQFDVLIFAILVAGLLLLRVPAFRKQRQAATSSARASS
jgi:DMSO/TMAO reductase YedYZ heme-binding membrane subunit